MGFVDRNSVKEYVKVGVETVNYIKLDIGCGFNKQPGFVGMDKRDLPDVDIVHDLEVFPYPLEDNICDLVVGSHIYEHITPKYSVDFINELWRITRVGGSVWLVMPYAGTFGYRQDPTHCNEANEATFQYFCPNMPLYNIYRPKPFSLKVCNYQTNGTMEIVLIKLDEQEGLLRFKEMLKQYFPEGDFKKEFPDDYQLWKEEMEKKHE